MKVRLLFVLILGVYILQSPSVSASCISLTSDTSSEGKKVAIEIYSNPKELIVTVNKKQKYRVNLYNPNGAIIRSGDTESIFTIDMSKYEKGDYIVEVIELKTGNGYKKKIVQQ